MIADRAAGKMDGLTKIGAGGFRLQFGPECIHQLLAVKAMAIGKDQALDQSGAARPPPCRCRSALAIDRHAKLAEQVDLNMHSNHPRDMTPAGFVTSSGDAGNARGTPHG